MRYAIWLILGVNVALLSPAYAVDCDPKAQSCMAAPGTVEHSTWWCAHKTEESTCVAVDQVECKWEKNACVPK